MNYVNVISRKYYCQQRNSDDFSTNLTDYVSYFQGEIIETMKLSAVYEVSTVTNEDESLSIKAYSGVGGIYLINPYQDWKLEGMVVGNSIRIEYGASQVNSTILFLSGTLMRITDDSFFSTLGTTSGDSEAYVLKITTVPTSLIFKFGLRKNSIEATFYSSLLDGQEQMYTKNGIGASPTELDYASTESSNLGSVEATYLGIVGTDDWVFQFQIDHIFIIPHFLSEWLDEYTSGLPPETFAGSESLRYFSYLNFGVNIANPNDGKVFLDDYELGSVGFLGQNFNSGSSNYIPVSTVIESGGVEVDEVEITATTTVTAQIKKLDGNFSAGVKGYLYHTKLTEEAGYSLNDNTYEENYVIDKLLQTEGVASADSTIISNYEIEINGDDASILDITFDISYDASTQLKFVDEDYIALMLATEDSSLSATLSDRVMVRLGVYKVNRDTDDVGVITDFECSFNNPDSASTSNNIHSWNNRIHEMNFSFLLSKDEDKYYQTKLQSLKLQQVAYSTSEDIFFKMSSYTFPMGIYFVGAGVIVDGMNYQIKNVNTQRFLPVPYGDELREVKLIAVSPASYEATQEFSGKVGFMIPWQEWILNPGVPWEFYDGALPPNFNRNQRTSNYSHELGFDYYVFLTAEVWTQKRVDDIIVENTTTVHLMSDTSYVTDFDTNVIGSTWTQETTILNPAGDEVEFIDLSGTNTIIIVLSETGAGTISLNTLRAEIVIEDYEGLTRPWRLHSTLDWTEDDNVLLPFDGTDGVEVTQDIVGDTITLKCYVDGTKLSSSFQNIYGHLYK